MVGEALDESAVKVGKAQERLYLLLIVGSWPFSDSSHLDRVHRDSTIRDDQSQILDLGLSKLTLLRLQIEFVEAKSFQYQSCDSVMFL